MGDIIAKYIGFPLQDKVRKTNIIGTLNFLRESQYWDSEMLNNYRLYKLKALVKHASVNIPYYNRLFREIDLNVEDIRCIEDIRLIPVLTKEIVRKENMNLVSKNSDMRFIKQGKTGGTTGAPVKTFKDTASRTMTWASYYRWYEWMGINYYNKTVTLWGAKTVLSSSLKSRFKSFLIDYLQNKKVIDTFKMNPEKLPLICDSIHNFDPVLLKGYLSSILVFAEFVEMSNLTFENLKAVASTTETLLPHNREYIKSVFNVPVFDQYGCGEVSGIAYECACHNGLHVNNEHVIVEVHDEWGSDIIDKSGRIIVTDLDNYVMPFIRYETGDIASMSSKVCACGVNQPLLKNIEGRTADTIVLRDGSKVHGVFFTDILFELNILTNSVKRFQVQQQEQGVISFIIEKGEMLDEDSRNKILNALVPFFNKVDIVVLDKIPCESNGKFLYIKSTRHSN